MIQRIRKDNLLLHNINEEFKLMSPWGEILIVALFSVLIIGGLSWIL